jgi:hypothetical protein
VRRSRSRVLTNACTRSSGMGAALKSTWEAHEGTVMPSRLAVILPPPNASRLTAADFPSLSTAAFLALVAAGIPILPHPL